MEHVAIARKSAPHPVTQGFVIHLPSATRRRAQVDLLVRDCPLAVEVIDAVDGRAMDKQAFDAVTGHRLHAPAYPFSLTHGEVGCFLSHRNVWQAIVDRGLPSALILEDDASIDTEKFERTLDLLARNMRDGDYVRLPAKVRDRERMVVASSGQTKLFVNSRVGLTTLAQVVTLGAARRLLEITQRFDRPVDTFLQMPWITRVHMLTVSGSGISEVSGRLGGSIIQKPSAGRLPLRREMLRFNYRRKIRALQDGHDGIQDE